MPTSPRRSPVNWYNELSPIFRALALLILGVATAVIGWQNLKYGMSANAQGTKANAMAIAANAKANIEATKILGDAVGRQAIAQAVTNSRITSTGQRNEDRFDTIQRALTRIEGRQSAISNITDALERLERRISANPNQ